MPKDQSEDPPAHILDEILAKFVYSAPLENLANFEQLMFLVEHAWWYYEDCVREKYTNLRKFNHYNTFATMLFNNCGVLKEHAADLPNILERYREYKSNIPVYGAILLDTELERVLLVRGYKSASGWGFPRGKVNHKETDIACACREVLEETGLEIDSMVRPDDMIEATSDNKLCQLFIVSGLDPEAAKFAPQCQKEIGAFGWHYLHELPATVEEANRAYIASGGSRHRFFMVQPFVRKLRAWVSNRRRELGMPPPPWEPAHRRGQRVGEPSTQQQQPQQQQSQQQQQQGADRGLLRSASTGSSSRAPASHQGGPSAAPAAAAAAVAAAAAAAGVSKAAKSASLSSRSTAGAVGSDRDACREEGSRAPQGQLPKGAMSANGASRQTGRCEPPNLVMSSAFRFDREAIMQCF